MTFETASSIASASDSTSEDKNPDCSARHLTTPLRMCSNLGSLLMVIFIGRHRAGGPAPGKGEHLQGPSCRKGTSFRSRSDPPSCSHTPRGSPHSNIGRLHRGGHDNRSNKRRNNVGRCTVPRAVHRRCNETSGRASDPRLAAPRLARALLDSPIVVHRPIKINPLTETHGRKF